MVRGRGPASEADSHRNAPSSAGRAARTSRRTSSEGRARALADRKGDGPRLRLEDLDRREGRRAMTLHEGPGSEIWPCATPLAAYRLGGAYRASRAADAAWPGRRGRRRTRPRGRADETAGGCPSGVTDRTSTIGTMGLEARVARCPTTEFTGRPPALREALPGRQLSQHGTQCHPISTTVRTSWPGKSRRSVAGTDSSSSRRIGRQTFAGSFEYGYRAIP